MEIDGPDISKYGVVLPGSEPGAVEAVILNGRRFDCGSVQGYLDAIVHVACYRGH
jgi:UTP--glucose-1-phosphate uridylyltransferase